MSWRLVPRLGRIRNATGSKRFFFGKKQQKTLVSRGL
jgi:hypothetical protein